METAHDLQIVIDAAGGEAALPLAETCGMCFVKKRAYLIEWQNAILKDGIIVLMSLALK